MSASINENSRVFENPSKIGPSSNNGENPGKPNPQSPKQDNDPRTYKNLKKKKKSRQVSQEQIKQEYQNFIQKISVKGYKIDCTLGRFLELCTNRQTGELDKQSIVETKRGLQE